MSRQPGSVLMRTLKVAALFFVLCGTEVVAAPQWMQAPAYQPSQTLTLDGWIDHTSTWVSDSSYAGSFAEDVRLHTARVVVGGHGRLPMRGGVSYLLRGGATLAQNSLHDQRHTTPELQAEFGWTPLEQLQFGVFGRYGWRRPNAFLVDSLRLRDLIIGATVAARPMSHTELEFSAGNRRAIDENVKTDHRFLRAEVEQRVPQWNQFLIRAWGESAGYGLADSLDFDLQRNLAGLTLAGEVPGGVNLHSNSAYVYREGVRRILGQNRLRTRIGQRHRLAANAGADFTKQDEREVYRRHADASWRWMQLDALGSELRVSSDRVMVDDEDFTHRRDLLALAVYDWRPLTGPAARIESAGRHESWRHFMDRGIWLKRDLVLRGELGGGWAETREFGSGVVGRGSLELVQPVEPLPWLGLSLRELLRGEIFRMQDREIVAPDAEETQKELDHQLSFSTTVLPQGLVQAGHRIEWRRHVGSDLVFNDDTLRNTLNNELWFKWRKPRLQTQVSGMVIHHLVKGDPADFEQRLSLHLRWQPIRLASFNVRGVWRPERDSAPERVWVRAFTEFEMNRLTLSADLRFVGDPAGFGDKDTQAWIHVLRRFW